MILARRSPAGQAAARDPAPLRRLGLGPKDVALVRRLPLFAGISDDQLGRMLAGSQVRRHECNARLFVQDSPATRFYVVLEGWVQLFRATPDGDDSTIAVFGRGESLVEAAMLDSGRYLVSGRVVARARLLVIPAKAFVEHLQDDPDLVLNLLASIAVHLRRLMRQVEQLTHRSSPQRVADFLLRLCAAGERRAELVLPLNKSLIAAHLGMRPETFSRSLARLREAGVEMSGSRVTIHDVPQLMTLALADRE